MNSSRQSPSPAPMPSDRPLSALPASRSSELKCFVSPTPMASVTEPACSPVPSQASMRTSPSSSERLMTRTKPWYPFSPVQRAADGNRPTRCPNLTSARANTGASERSGVLSVPASRRKGCGGEGSGVDAYIVSGICACACSRSMRRYCSSRACRADSACAEWRSQSSTAEPISPCAPNASGTAARATATSTAFTTTLRARVAMSGEEREVLGVVERKALRPCGVRDVEIPPQRLVHMLGVE